MKISEKQIFHLMEAARLITLDKGFPSNVREFFEKLIYDINHQQSEELKEIE